MTLGMHEPVHDHQFGTRDGARRGSRSPTGDHATAAEGSRLMVAAPRPAGAAGVPGGDPRAGREARLVEDVRDVVLHRALRQVQPQPDLPVAQALGHQVRHLLLPPGERGVARPARLLLALILTGVVAVTLDWAVAALVPREPEGTLVLIGIVGYRGGRPGRNRAVPAFPRAAAAHRPGVGHRRGRAQRPAPLAYAAALGLFAMALWRGRGRLHPVAPG
jgi:hypothetical protein